VVAVVAGGFVVVVVLVVAVVVLVVVVVVVVVDVTVVVVGDGVVTVVPTDPAADGRCEAAARAVATPIAATATLSSRSQAARRIAIL
jgi:hypothetical protein